MENNVEGIVVFFFFPSSTRLFWKWIWILIAPWLLVPLRIQWREKTHHDVGLFFRRLLDQAARHLLKMFCLGDGTEEAWYFWSLQKMKLLLGWLFFFFSLPFGHWCAAECEHSGFSWSQAISYFVHKFISHSTISVSWLIVGKVTELLSTSCHQRNMPWLSLQHSCQSATWTRVCRVHCPEGCRCSVWWCLICWHGLWLKCPSQERHYSGRFEAMVNLPENKESSFSSPSPAATRFLPTLPLNLSHKKIGVDWDWVWIGVKSIQSRCLVLVLKPITNAYPRGWVSDRWRSWGKHSQNV